MGSTFSGTVPAESTPIYIANVTVCSVPFCLILDFMYLSSKSVNYNIQSKRIYPELSCCRIPNLLRIQKMFLSGHPSFFISIGK